MLDSNLRRRSNSLPKPGLQKSMRAYASPSCDIDRLRAFMLNVGEAGRWPFRFFFWRSGHRRPCGVLEDSSPRSWAVGLGVTQLVHHQSWPRLNGPPPLHPFTFTVDTVRQTGPTSIRAHVLRPRRRGYVRLELVSYNLYSFARRNRR